MFDVANILAPIDFSKHAESGLRYACLIAAKFGATLHLLHVLPEVIAPVGPEPMILPSMPAEFYAETEEAAHAALERCLQPEWPAPPDVKHEVIWGDSVARIVDYASDHKIDLIVLATHGRSGLSHVLLGSVAERIVREAPCPVLTVRDRRND